MHEIVGPSVQELLWATQRILESPPSAGETWDDRVAKVGALTRKLDECGLDGVSLVRFGMSDLFAGPVLGSVVGAIVLERQGREFSTPVDVDSWRRYLGVGNGWGRSDDDLEEVLTYANRRVAQWIEVAPFEELVRLVPPPPDPVAPPDPVIGHDAERLVGVYHWLVDRNLSRALDTWSWSSLRHEYRYATTGIAPYAPERLLIAPAPDLDALAHALAAGVLRGEDNGRLAGWQEFMEAVQEQARMLLRQERCLEAAALFEFLIGQYPGRADLRNNLAFCLVTSKPSEAYGHLMDAQSLGYSPRTLVLYNRACCALSEAQKRDVLFDANRHWVDDLERTPVEAFIWRRRHGRLVPESAEDVRRDLADAAAGLAVELGEFDRESLWLERKTSLSRLGLSGPGSG